MVLPMWVYLTRGLKILILSGKEIVREIGQTENGNIK